MMVVGDFNGRQSESSGDWGVRECLTNRRRCVIVTSDSRRLWFIQSFIMTRTDSYCNNGFIF